ncbi:hypothetical protein KUTeg_023946 [Tegillarca granosa]|uniref:Uncharacterized protein n=1 Tax=Tegillarca granosa TaxID=220873 RepID=A0ABQ9E1Q3_TEGGR|nr:hypothetical protein KUTeg_023946 [Tegillarca granosa]
MINKFIKKNKTTEIKPHIIISIWMIINFIVLKFLSLILKKKLYKYAEKNIVFLSFTKQNCHFIAVYKVIFIVAFVGIFVYLHFSKKSLQTKCTCTEILNSDFSICSVTVFLSIIICK